MRMCEHADLRILERVWVKIMDLEIKIRVCLVVGLALGLKLGSVLGL